MKARTEMSPDSISAPHPFHIDRTQIVPHHVGENVLPNFHLFDKLLRFASRRPQPVAIRDDNLGVEKTFLQLLTDVLAIRTTLQAALCPAALHDLSYGQDVFIGLLAPGGYEYTVGFIAILALGAAVVPMSVALPVEEASYFVLKSRCVAILAESKAIRLGNSLVCHVQQNQGLSIPCVSIAPYLKTSVIPAQCITISSNTMININAAGLVIFTSGTTGPPKGAVQRRGYICAAAEAVAHHYQITSADVVLHVLPVHHATGIGITFLPFLVSGACIDFRSGSFDERWMWERWKRGGLTFFSGVPTIYMRMMRYYMQAIDKLGREKKHEYIAGARQFRALLCGSSALPTPVQNFWTDILGGKRLLTRYGATEFGAVFKVDLEPGVTPEGSVGQIVPGVTVKLSEGNEGMVLVKGPHIFSGYLFDKKATANAHDADGFFITGDIARREGSYYWILGRASVDIIKTGGYKISALDIEREILGLPYVSEVMVVGVEDEEFGQRVAAVISLRDVDGTPKGDGNYSISNPKSLTLDDLRRDLRSKLASYKMPTVLRLIEGELPKSGTGKVQKKILGPEYFPSNYRRDPDVQAWTRRDRTETVSKL